MGIRKRILLGFISLGFLLFIAGLISYFELARLNESTVTTIDKGASGITTAKDMLDLIEEQDIIITNGITKRTAVANQKNEVILSKLSLLANNLSENFPENKMIQQVISDMNIYESTVKNITSDTTVIGNAMWYFEMYKPAYRNFAHSTKDFMVQTQYDVSKKAQEIKGHAYRATMQGITALAAAIVIIIIFFFMIDTYFIRPVTTTTKSLKRYLAYKTPFEIKAEGREEVYQLQNYIKQLITNLKNASNK
ncbi:MAG: hypothetical protein R3Y50_04625 [Rikenellaceae bacterium]